MDIHIATMKYIKKNIRITSDRLSLFKQNTAVYTGKPNMPERLLNYKKLGSKIKEMTEELKVFEFNHPEKNAYELIQELRGNKYVFIDSILNIEDGLPEHYMPSIIVS